MKLAGGAVGIGGKEQGMVPAIDVRNVHATVGADEAVPRLGNEHAVLAPDDGAALAQGKLDDAGIHFIFLRPGDRIGRGLDRSQVDDASLSFRNDLVLDDKNVTGFECVVIFVQRFEQLIDDRITAPDCAGHRDGNNAERDLELV